MADSETSILATMSIGEASHVSWVRRARRILMNDIGTPVPSACTRHRNQQDVNGIHIDCSGSLIGSTHLISRKTLLARDMLFSWFLLLDIIVLNLHTLSLTRVRVHSIIIGGAVGWISGALIHRTLTGRCPKSWGKCHACGTHCTLVNRHRDFNLPTFYWSRNLIAIFSSTI